MKFWPQLKVIKVVFLLIYVHVQIVQYFNKVFFVDILQSNFLIEKLTLAPDIKWVIY